MFKKKQVSERDVFVQALCGLYHLNEHIYYFGFSAHLYPKSHYRTILSVQDINNRKELDAMMKWYLEEGTSHQFQRLWQTLRLYTKEEREQIIASIHPGDDELPLIRMIHEHLHTIPKGGIYALDLARYVFMTKGAHEMELLTDEEANERYVFAIKELKAAYANWEEVVIGFALGKQFESNNASPYFMIKPMKYVKRLLSSRHSPMNQVTW